MWDTKGSCACRLSATTRTFGMIIFKLFVTCVLFGRDGHHVGLREVVHAFPAELAADA
jgi:hypothetical protein